MAEVVFRRIKGRIVPIKKDDLSERQRKALSATGYGAAGVATGVAAGKLANRMLLESAHLENKSRDLARKFGALRSAGPLYQKAALDTGREAISTRLKSMRMFKARTSLMSLGKLTVAGLFGIGASDAINAVAGGKDTGKADDLAGHFVGAAAAASVMYPYYKGASAKWFGKGKAGAFSAVVRAFRGVTKARTPKRLNY